MTKRMIAASLAAAFSFGTAVGLALSQAGTQNEASAIASAASKEPAAKPSSDDMVCIEQPGGQALCWPKENAPREGSATTCVEQNGTTLCFTQPQQNKPGLDM